MKGISSFLQMLLTQSISIHSCGTRRTDTHRQVVELMDHENVDVALAAVELINELTDPEALTESEESEGAKVRQRCRKVLPHPVHSPCVSIPAPTQFAIHSLQ